MSADIPAYAEKLTRLKHYISSTKDLLNSPWLEKDDPELFIIAREQLTHLERLLKRLEGGEIC